MHGEDNHEFEDESEDVGDEWDDFRRDDGNHVSIEDLKQLPLAEMLENIGLFVLDNYFPETTIWRKGDVLVCEIQEHVYRKHWEHKFSAYGFVEAMERQSAD